MSGKICWDSGLALVFSGLFACLAYLGGCLSLVMSAVASGRKQVAIVTDGRTR